MSNSANRFRLIFPNHRTVLPVVHVKTPEQARRNVRIAREAGADGVFLINHGISDDSLLDIHAAVAEREAGFWIGVNCLGRGPEQVFESVTGRVGGVWADNAGIEENQAEQPYAARVLAARNACAPGCLYFGGVAFKYQRPVAELEAAVRIAAEFMDVVTTSGPGTGRAADLDKIRRMKQALGAVPLAIASGITPENVGDYLPHADCFLVATGISRNFDELDPERVSALVSRVAAHEGEQ